MGVNLFTQIVGHNFQLQLWRRNGQYYAVIQQLFAAKKWNTGYFQSAGDAVAKGYEIITYLYESEKVPSRYDIHNL